MEPFSHSLPSGASGNIVVGATVYLWRVEALIDADHTKAIRVI